MFIIEFNTAFTNAVIIVENIELRSKMKASHMKRKMLLTYFRLKHVKKNNATSTLLTVLLGGQFWFGTVWHGNPFENDNLIISNH